MAFLPFVNQALRHERKQHPNEWHAIKGGEILAENSKTNGATAQGRMNDVKISLQLQARTFSLKKKKRKKISNLTK